MSPKVKAKWVKALRSGEYQQTVEAYRDRKGFCCLGVLHVINGLSCDPGLSFVGIQAKFGIDKSDLEELADLNDEGATFEQIALCIENGL